MELDEFLKFWDVSREELASICDCSLTTVHHWFSQGEHRRVLSDQHKQRLALAHYIWTAVAAEPEQLRALRKMYDPMKRRAF